MNIIGRFSVRDIIDFPADGQTTAADSSDAAGRARYLALVEKIKGAGGATPIGDNAKPSRFSEGGLTLIGQVERTATADAAAGTPAELSGRDLLMYRERNQGRDPHQVAADRAAVDLERTGHLVDGRGRRKDGAR